MVQWTNGAFRGFRRSSAAATPTSTWASRRARRRRRLGGSTWRWVDDSSNTTRLGKTTCTRDWELKKEKTAATQQQNKGFCGNLEGKTMVQACKSLLGARISSNESRVGASGWWRGEIRLSPAAVNLWRVSCTEMRSHQPCSSN